MPMVGRADRDRVKVFFFCEQFPKILIRAADGGGGGLAGLAAVESIHNVLRGFASGGGPGVCAAPAGIFKDCAYLVAKLVGTPIEILTA